MRLLYLDASAGVSGDMFVGALVDLGASVDVIRAHVESLGVPGFAVQARRVDRRGLAGTKFDVLAPDGRPVDEIPEVHRHLVHCGAHDPDDGHDHDHDHGHAHGHPVHPHHDSAHDHGEGETSGEPSHHHRGLREIRTILRSAELPDAVAADALAVFELLGAAEARVHGTDPEAVHFHEVGALDAIADIVAASSAFHQLGVDEAWCSPIHVGMGTVRCAHGVLPVPAPATLELLKGIPIYSDGVRGELATPTGAALVRHFCTRFGEMPALVVEEVGYGAGSKDFGIPNLLRATVGRAAQRSAGASQIAVFG